MWNLFKKKEKTINRVKYIDWNKVKTVKDMVAIFSQIGLTIQIKVSEQWWTNHGIDHLLSDKTYNDANGTWEEETK
jgi:hypothetical protein